MSGTEKPNPNCRYGRWDCMPCINCDAYIPPMTIANHVRAMTDEELAKWLAKLLADYTSLLYDGEYVPSEDAVGEITGELLRQLQQPYESPTGQKG